MSAIESPSGEPQGHTLRWIWAQKYFRDGGGLRWRDEADGLPPSALLITSPHDVEARFGKKRSTTWIGYKVHLTETCDNDAPHLIVNAKTAPVGRATPEIHGSLPDRDLLPGKQMVGAGYIASDLLLLQSVHQLRHPSDSVAIRIQRSSPHCNAGIRPLRTIIATAATRIAATQTGLLLPNLINWYRGSAFGKGGYIKR